MKTPHLVTRRQALQLTGVAAAVAVLPTAAAQEAALQQYAVELVLFRPVNPAAGEEDFNTAPTAETPAPVTEEGVLPLAATAPATDSSIQPLNASQFKLAAIAAALQRNRNYTPLAHIGWTQPGFGLDSPRPVTIDAMVPAAASVTGTVSVSRGRYLRMVLNLTWQAPDGKRYVLREQRRLQRSGEKHYFDHPYFGVVALVTPKA
jgi:hypothetical protein